LDEFFVQNCAGAIPGANSVAGRNNQPLVREFVVKEQLGNFVLTEALLDNRSP
jgi:hypothetical protein